RKVAKIFGYAETIVPCQSPEDFKSNFRLRGTSVERLVTLLALWVQIPRRRPVIDVTKQTLIFVWSLANLECFGRLCRNGPLWTLRFYGVQGGAPSWSSCFDPWPKLRVVADGGRLNAYYFRLRCESRLSWSPRSNRRKPLW
ncbi:unnamed protein product, partial [Ixodes persulcatus]